MSCKNDTLKVTWSTDVVYDSTVNQIPDDIRQRLTDRLLFESQHPILSLVIVTKSPPLVSHFYHPLLQFTLLQVKLQLFILKIIARFVGHT